MYRVGVKAGFSAAHKIENHPGRCSKLHGHSWEVEVVFRAKEVGEEGMIVDFDLALKALGEVISPFDHAYLNEISPFDEMPPTAENIARYVYENIKRKLDGGGISVDIDSARVWESSDSWASFEGEV
ncbi:MAG: 6-carboxytetrahydropterin synthase QueD [Actinomycetota bacterium]|nr:6-carboxytetrahydropterin synthase QueD [Actinomycetota bacterium]